METITKKVYKIDSLKEILSLTSYNRLTLAEIASKRVYTSSYGWIDFFFDNDHLSDDGCTTAQRVCDLVCRYLWKKTGAKEYIVRGIITNPNPFRNYGIYSRLWIELRKDGTIEVDYCTGQDYNSEIRALRRLLTQE